MRSLCVLPRSFSLRTALLLVAVVCVVLAVGVRRAKRVLALKRAVQAVEACGGNLMTDPGDAGVEAFDAPDWKLALGLAPVPKVIEVRLVGYQEGYQDPQNVLPQLTAFSNLLKLEILDEWFDDRSCEDVKMPDGLVDLFVEANEGLTAKGFVLLLRPKLESLGVSGADLRGLADRQLDWPPALQFVGLEFCQGIEGAVSAQLSQNLGKNCDLQTADETYRGGQVVVTNIGVRDVLDTDTEFKAEPDAPRSGKEAEDAWQDLEEARENDDGD